MMAVVSSGKLFRPLTKPVVSAGCHTPPSSPEFSASVGAGLDADHSSSVGESRGAKSKGIFHKICNQNQMNNVSAGKNELNNIPQGPPSLWP